MLNSRLKEPVDEKRKPREENEGANAKYLI